MFEYSTEYFKCFVFYSDLGSMKLEFKSGISILVSIYSIRVQYIYSSSRGKVLWILTSPVAGLTRGIIIAVFVDNAMFLQRSFTNENHDVCWGVWTFFFSFSPRFCCGGGVKGVPKS